MGKPTERKTTDAVVTPEMLEAGLKAFRRWNPIEDDASWIVEDIFEEMTKAAQKRKA